MGFNYPCRRSRTWLPRSSDGCVNLFAISASEACKGNRRQMVTKHSSRLPDPRRLADRRNVLVKLWTWLYVSSEKRTEKITGEWDAKCRFRVPVVAIDDVEDDEGGGVDDAEGSEARHRDEQRQRSSEHIIRVNVRPVTRHPKIC